MNEHIVFEMASVDPGPTRYLRLRTRPRPHAGVEATIHNSKGTPITWLSMTPVLARALAAALIEAADAAE